MNRASPPPLPLAGCRCYILYLVLPALSVSFTALYPPCRPLLVFFFYCSGDHRDLHSFPTRRSSDLDTHGCSSPSSVSCCGPPSWAVGVPPGRGSMASAMKLSKTSCRMIVIPC